MVYDGILIIIPWYSKTFALTHLNQMDVHALLPRILRLIYILNAFIRPMAVEWAKALCDNEAPDPQSITPVETEPSGGETLSDEELEMSRDKVHGDDGDKEDDEDEGEIWVSTTCPLKPSEIEDWYLFSLAGWPFTVQQFSNLF
jgi:hypothetical protein